MSGRNLTTELGRVLEDAGGIAAPRERHAQIRAALGDSLAHGRGELGERRSGYARPVEVGLAATASGLVALSPAPLGLRVDPAAAPERAWLVAVATVAGLVEAADLPAPASAEDLVLEAGDYAGFLVLSVPVRNPDPEFAALAVEERLRRIDRLRARAHALPPGLVQPVDLRPPLAADLRTAEAVARLGGDPVDSAAVDALEEALVALVPRVAGRVSPHDEPDPSLRAARRMVQRLAGMGKWGGYHTAFDHLSRGFAGNERELASAVGEVLLADGILEHKQSVGQRHVFLNPRRAADVYALIEEGTLPSGVTLP